MSCMLHNYLIADINELRKLSAADMNNMQVNIVNTYSST